MKDHWELLEPEVGFDMFGNISGKSKDTGMTFLPNIKYHPSEGKAK